MCSARNQVDTFLAPGERVIQVGLCPELSEDRRLCDTLLLRLIHSVVLCGPSGLKTNLRIPALRFLRTFSA